MYVECTVLGRVSCVADMIALTSGPVRSGLTCGGPRRVRRARHSFRHSGPAQPSLQAHDMTSYNLPRHPISSPLHSVTVFSLVLNTLGHLCGIPLTLTAQLISTDLRSRSDRRPDRVLTVQTLETRHTREALVSRLASRGGRHSPRVHTTSIPVRNHSLAARSRCTRARSGYESTRDELSCHHPPLHPWISTTSPPMARG